MTPATLAFDLLALLAVGLGAGVVFLRNPVHACLALAGTLLAQAGLFVILGAEFLAGVTVFVYAGGILVLFLFVVMLLGAPLVGRLRPAWGWGAGAAFLLALPILLRSGHAVGMVTAAPADAAAVAGPILQTHGFSFVVGTVLLLTAMVAALVASRRSEG